MIAVDASVAAKWIFTEDYSDQERALPRATIDAAGLIVAAHRQDRRYDSGWRTHMLTDYIQAAMRLAEYETLENGTIFGRIPGFQGVWANNPDQDSCRDELREVLEDWILVGLRSRHTLPF